MKIGLALPHYDFSFPDGRRATLADVVATAQRAEQIGFDSVWVSDHLFLDLARYGGPARRFDSPEALTMMGAIAAGTERVRVGSLVLCAAFRNARILSQQMASLADLSAGRAEFGLGSGWYEAEFDEAGLDFATAPQRLDHLEQVLAVVDTPGRAPIWIGGKGGPRIMRITAERADGWNIVWWMTPEAYGEIVPRLDKACATIGRDPATIRRSVGLHTLLGTDTADIAARYERMQAWTPGGAINAMQLETFAANGLAGTPAQCAERIAAFAALGVDEIILSAASLPFALFEDEQIDLAGDLIQALR